jgi:hypothetical protein
MVGGLGGRSNARHMSPRGFQWIFVARSRRDARWRGSDYPLSTRPVAIATHGRVSEMGSESRWSDA